MTVAIRQVGLFLAFLASAGLGPQAGRLTAAEAGDRPTSLEQCMSTLEADGPTATAACIAQLLPALEQRADAALRRALSGIPQMRRKSELRALNELWREWRRRKCGFLFPPGRDEGMLRYLEQASCLHEETVQWLRFLEGLADDSP